MICTSYDILNVKNLESDYKIHFGRNEFFSIQCLVNIKHSKMKLIAGVISLRSFWQKWNFILGDNTLCKDYTEMKSHQRKYLHMRISRKYTIQAYLGISRTLVYSEPRHIHNPGIFRTLAYSKSKAYSEHCQISTMKRFAKIVNGYNYFHKLQLFSQSLSLSLLHEINILR